VADVADEVAVMYGGRIVERGPTQLLYADPEMPYTLGLLSSVPRMDKELLDRLDPIRGNPPSPINLPKGCVFQPRCNYSDRVPNNACAEVRPELLPTGPDHLVRCHLQPDERRRISQEILTVLAGS
jgi:peptide/nickel transport system ATP-binding protein